MPPPLPPASPLFDPQTLSGLDAARASNSPGADETAHAVDLAHHGRHDEAAATLRAALAHTDDIRLLFLGFQYFFRTIDHAEAEALTERRLAITERHAETEHTARACTNLGLIHLVTGRPHSARTLMERAVAIDERLGNQHGLARDLGNLANVFEETGDLDTAESLNRRSLEIAERIGAREIAAGKLANLGDIALARANPAEAAALWRRALTEFEHLGLEKWRAAYAAKLAALTL